MSNRILRLAASVFLIRHTPTKEEIEDLVNRLLDFPRFSDLEEDEIEILERNPRALSAKLLSTIIMGTENSNKTLQNFAREVLDNRQAEPRQRQILPPLEPLPTFRDVHETMRVMSTNRIRVAAVANGLDAYEVRVPEDMFHQAISDSESPVLVQLIMSDGLTWYARPVDVSKYPMQVEVDGRHWNNYHNTVCEVSLVEGLRTVQSLDFDINLNKGDDWSRYRQAIEDAIDGVPAMYLGQRINIDPDIGLQIMVTRMIPENEKVLKMPSTNSEITYNVRNRKTTLVKMGKCLACHGKGTITCHERGALHRTFCGKECQAVYYM